MVMATALSCAKVLLLQFFLRNKRKMYSVRFVFTAMEITSVRHRVIVSQTLQASFAFGFMLLALFAYLERNWIYLNLIISLPIILFVPFYVLYVSIIYLLSGFVE